MMTTVVIQRDFTRATRNTKARLEHIRDSIDAILSQREDEFADPRMVILELIMAVHELESAAVMMRRTWYPRRFV